MLFKGNELDFDIFDADTAEVYEEAVEAARVAAVKVPGETLATAIRRQCAAVFNFFDALFGDGFHKDLFGERTNLMECINTFREFIKAVDDQRAALDTVMQEVSAEGAAPNRAARRAAIKPAKA